MPVAKDGYIRPTSISFLRTCQSPATDVVVVAFLRGVFFASSLISACSLGPFSLRKQVFYASRGFCLNGGKQRCGCFQMRHKLVRAVHLMAFMTTAIEETAGFVLLKEGDENDGGDWLGEETGDGAPGGKKMTTLLAAVNEDLDVQTYNERSSSSRDHRYECTSIVASETLRVSCQENFQAGALRQNVGKITTIHLKDPQR